MCSSPKYSLETEDAVREVSEKIMNCEDQMIQVARQMNHKGILSLLITLYFGDKEAFMHYFESIIRLEIRYRAKILIRSCESINNIYFSEDPVDFSFIKSELDKQINRLKDWNKR